ncbi:MAG TPA: hypothetical protein VNM90_19710, partial [Haliangium sp.]|nr:hypothetical protein [Haliangium sp.]
MSERTPPPTRPQPPPSTSEPPILEPAVDPEPARQVHRRHVAGFLAGLSFAMPLAASFSWLWPGRRAACPSGSPGTAPAEPAHAARTAATAFRPRLLVVLPEDAMQQYRLGHALGEYLNHGTDAALAPLAAVDLACIAAGEIDLPATAQGQGPLALLLLAGATQRVVRFELPEQEVDGRIDEALAERVIDERIAIVSNAVRRAVIDHDQVVGISQRMLSSARVQEIATRARAGHAITDWRTDSGFGLQQRLQDETDQSGKPQEPMAQSLMPDEAAHFAPALLAVALSVEGEARTSLMSTLAEVARRRVVQSEVPGAEWARSGGCGTEFENRETNVVIGCGMGHVPERSRRFLHFYTLK